eukprot:2084920-Pyramimonas_sp.AAC.1
MHRVLEVRLANHVIVILACAGAITSACLPCIASSIHQGNHVIVILAFKRCVSNILHAEPPLSVP